MPNPFEKYARWLHTRWPSGKVENLPVVGERGETNVPGLYVCGDLTGIPLLKFSLDSGSRVVRHLSETVLRQKDSSGDSSVFDVVIVGAGVSGFAAAVEAKKRGLSYCLIESTAALSTLVNFPKGKPIYTYPNEMTPEGDLQVSAEIKEGLIEELNRQIERHGIETLQGRAEIIEREGNRLKVVLSDREAVHGKTVVAALGRSGNYRRLEVPGEDLDKVYNRLHDPKDYCGQKALVVGGGDSALETAIALAGCGGKVTLSYRKPEFSRPKPENIERLLALTENPTAEVSVETPSSERVTTAAGDFLGKPDRPGSLTLKMSTEVEEIREDSVTLRDAEGKTEQIDNDVVFAMTGREPPLDFFRKSGVRIQGEWGIRSLAAMTGFLLFCVWMYLWKSGGNPINHLWVQNEWFPYNLPELFASLIESPKTLLGTIAISMTQPAFYYGLLYCLVVTGFGVARIKRRKTPYITKQTITLILIQAIPLFVLPYILFPWLGHNDLLPKTFADAFFPEVDYDPPWPRVLEGSRLHPRLAAFHP